MQARKTRKPSRRHGTCPTGSSFESSTGRRDASWPQSTRSISLSANDSYPTTTPQSYFNVTGLLGEGSHGKVLLARSEGCLQTQDGLAYAIKVLLRKVPHGTRGTRELELLEWIAGRPQDGTSAGVCFLQKMIKGFERGDHLFIVMVRSQLIQLYSILNLNRRTVTALRWPTPRLHSVSIYRLLFSRTR